MTALPPVPPITDNDRYQTYTISSSTSYLDLSYPLFGDATDIVVYKNDEVFTEWTFSSIAGGSAISTLPRPIEDGRITFNVAQTSGTFEIVYRSKPTFTPVLGSLTRREYNQDQAKQYAVLRELRRESDIVSDARDEAVAAAAAAALSYDGFDDRYLGAKATDPSVDNDGDALIIGAIYFNSASGLMRVWDGSAWANVRNTAADVKTLYESNADTNAFTDAEQAKLVGVEAGADVTDNANVTAAIGADFVADITALKALATADVSRAIVDDSTPYFFTAGDYTSTEDDYAVVKATDTAIASGAWVKKFYDAPTPEDFGWLGDGTADANAQARFFSYADNFGGILKFKRGGQYKLASSVALTRATQLVFEDGAYIDASGLTTGTTALTFSGSQSASTALTGDAAQGDLSISVTSATGFAVGKVIRVASDDQYDPVRTASEIGELNYVVGVSGTTISLLYPLREDYTTADSSRAHVITHLDGLVLDGMKIIGDDSASKTLGLVNIEYARNPILYGPVCELGGDFNIRLQDCLGGSVYSPRTSQVNDVGSTGYGVSIMGATQDIEIIGHKSFNSRHAFTTNNSETSGREGVVRDIIYRDFSVYNSAKSGGGVGGDAIDTHAASCGIVVRDGRIYCSTLQGINIEGSSATVDNVSIKGTLSNAIKFTNYTSRDGRFTASKITCDGIAGNLIEIRNNQSSATGKILSVDINGLYGKRYTGKIISAPNTSSADPHISYDDIQCDATDSTETTGQIYLASCASASPGSSVNIKNIPATCNAIRFTDVPYFFGSGNLGLAHYKTGTNTSASVFAWFYGSSTTVYGPKFTGTVEATATNTAKCFAIDAETQSIRFGEAYGNSNSKISATAGSVYYADFEPTLSKTISGGAITVTPSARLVTLAGEGATADTLDTINGMVDGQVLTVRSATSSYTITVAEGGNLQLASSTSVSLDSSRDTLTFIHTGSEIVQIAVSNN